MKKLLIIFFINLKHLEGGGGVKRRDLLRGGYKFLIIVFLILTFLQPATIQADSAPGPVVFSEINWDGSAKSTADEWLFLYNNTGNIINLTGWQIFDAVKNATMLQITEGTIAPKNYFIIANYGKDSSMLEQEPNLVTTKVSLSNTNFQIELRNPTGELIDVAGNGKAPFEQNPMKRILSPIASGNLESAWVGAPKNLGSQEKSPTTTSSIPFVLIKNMQSWQNKTIKTTAIVVVTNKIYTSSDCENCAIIRDSSDSQSHAELKLPKGITPKFGDKIEIIGKVSTSETPRVLASVVKIINNLKPTPIGLKNPKLMQWVNINGTLVRDSRSWFVKAGNQKIKLSRKQEVDLSSLQDNAKLTVTGIIIDHEPTTLKIFNQNDFKVTSINHQPEPEVIATFNNPDTVVETFDANSELGNLENFEPVEKNFADPELGADARGAQDMLPASEINGLEQQVKGAKSESKGNLIWLGIVALTAFVGGIFLQFYSQNNTSKVEEPEGRNLLRGE